MGVNYWRFLAGIMTSAAFMLPGAMARPCDSMVNEDVLNSCLKKQLATSDKELNAIYSKFRESLEGRTREQLKISELAWMKSRDNDCEFEAESAAGGTAYQSLYLDCQLVRTKARTDQLKKWAKSFPTR